MKKEKKAGRSGAERVMVQAKSQFAPTSPARHDITAGKARSLPSPDRASISLFSILPQKKKNPFSKWGRDVSGG